MEPWILLLAAVGMGWITVEMVQWVHSIRKLRQRELEALIGLDTQASNDPEPRQSLRQFTIRNSLSFVSLLLVLSFGITASLVVATFRAFAGAL